MSDQQTPKNRKERRAAAKQAGQPVQPPTSTPHIKLAHPDRTKPEGKTLLDVYEEKKSLLEHGQPFDPIHLDGRVRDESGNILEAGLETEEPIGPVGHAVFWSVTLAMLHFTLDVLVHNQYRQDIEWGPIFQHAFTAVPVLFLLVYILRSETARRWETARQLLYFSIAVAGGCYTIHVSNRYGYYAVMKRAPPLGTLWIWSVIEMNLTFGAASLALNAVYLFWKGYSIT